MSTALHAAFRLSCQQKQKKSIDQRAPQIEYEGIKNLRSLAMKNYLVTGGLLSLVESYNNFYYTLHAYLSLNDLASRGKNIRNELPICVQEGVSSVQ